MTKSVILKLESEAEEAANALYGAEFYNRHFRDDAYLAAEKYAAELAAEFVKMPAVDEDGDEYLFETFWNLKTDKVHEEAASYGVEEEMSLAIYAMAEFQAAKLKLAAARPASKPNPKKVYNDFFGANALENLIFGRAVK